jgi:hypothetical protein
VNRYGFKKHEVSSLAETAIDSYKPDSCEDLGQIIDQLIAHKILDLTPGQKKALPYFQGSEISEISSNTYRPETYIKDRLRAVGRKLIELGLDPSEFIDH